MGRTKVFVGNLSFKTNNKDLETEFEVAGKVASANIITRGSRSLGYGFVEMESEEEAKKSVELLNKKMIDGREIKVEVARPREERPPQDPNAPVTNGAVGEARGAGVGRGRGGGRFRGRGGRFRGRGGPRIGGAPINGGEGAPIGGGSPQTGGPGGSPQRRIRGPRPPRDLERAPRTPSNDTLFVANLPFVIDDAGLSKIFEGLNIKSAHVVRKHNERSKGFGFVEFFSQDDQQKALAAVDKKQVEGRELSVKVALTEVARNGAGSAPSSPATQATTESK